MCAISHIPNSNTYFYEYPEALEVFDVIALSVPHKHLITDLLSKISVLINESEYSMDSNNNETFCQLSNLYNFSYSIYVKYK